MFTFNHYPLVLFIPEAQSVSAEIKCREIDCSVENFLTTTIWAFQDCKLTKARACVDQVKC